MVQGLIDFLLSEDPQA